MKTNAPLPTLFFRRSLYITSRYHRV